MHPLAREEVVGRRVAEVIISRPDKPVSHEDQSYSSGYVRLDNGVLIELDDMLDLSEVPIPIDPVRMRELARDTEHEQTFQPAIGQKVVDLLRSRDFAGICMLLESGDAIAVLPGQFWVAPFFQKAEAVPVLGASSVWQE